MFEWGGFGMGALVGLTLFFGWFAVALERNNDDATWIFAGLFLIGCALIGGLS